MNDPRTAALTLWSRLISDEALDEVELQTLIDLVQQDSALQGQIEADASLHALMRSVTDVAQTENQFVQSVLERCRSMDHGLQPQEEEKLTEQEVAPYPHSACPYDEVSETKFINGTSTSYATHRLGKSASDYRKRRKNSALTATVLTATVFACLILAVWIPFGSPLFQPRGNSSEGIVKGPSPEPSARPEPESTNTDAPSANEAPSSAGPVVTDVVSERATESTNGNPPAPGKGETQEPILVDAPQMKPDIPNVEPANRSDATMPGQFVTLTMIEDPVWERKSLVGDRLGDEIIRLFAGSVELTFDQGAVVAVDGPVEFRPRATGQLELRRGRLLASVPQKAIGFTVSTPTSKIVDLGTEFEVAVNDTGESDVQVLKGEVEVAPVLEEGDEFPKWRLLPSQFDRASFYARPRMQGATPISASLRGPREQFQGFVSINGQTAEFSSPEAFENVRRRAESELARSQENALRQWKAFVDSMQNQMQGTMNLNGQEMQFGSMQDVMRMQNQMLETVRRAGGRSVESNFSGSFNVNGKVITFKTREEYEAARQTAFGPAATFGIGDVLGDQPENR